MKGLIYLFGILCFIYYTYSKPNGAPQDSCFYMTPRHIHPHTYRRVFPTKAMGLYNITTSADVFRPDRPIRVTLWGPPFKGFMMVAAEEGAKDWPTGIFYSEDGAAKRLGCLARGDTVTHQNNSYKDSVSVLWYGPENMMSEQIQFIATVVVNLTIYYTNIRSGMIRLDPSLHGTTIDPEAAGAGGEGGAPVAVTMDPWLSGQSATQAPTNWWSNLAGGRRGIAGNTGWGAGGAAATGGNSGWGAGAGANTGGTWGAANAASGTWGSQTGTGGSGGWGAQAGTGASGGWGAQAGTGASGGWGAQTGAGASGGWGSQTGTSGQGGWGTGTGGRANNQWGTNTGQTSWGQASGAGAGTGGWSANGDWQQVNQGSVTSSNWNAGQTSWHAPGDGRPIWNWNSGKIPTTAAPAATTPAPKPTQAGGKQTTSAWSAQALLELVQRLGLGPVARAP
ncbi:fibroin heavy chain-like isoform X2 [Ruditapes philippinarum]|uniref:fibroin heavy chain-like isoform X2 n=1 Tax=Ruditapes philippinarum TaxID=129788 RepID=UPI00295B960F|nr:fibroin heavy chain-like isoform X2 [Ruditapes philippinarum]